MPKVLSKSVTKINQEQWRQRGPRWESVQAARVTDSLSLWVGPAGTEGPW